MHYSVPPAPRSISGLVAPSGGAQCDMGASSSSREAQWLQSSTADCCSTASWSLFRGVSLFGRRMRVYMAAYWVRTTYQAAEARALEIEDPARQAEHWDAVSLVTRSASTGSHPPAYRPSAAAHRLPPTAQRPTPNAYCPTPNAQRPTPNAHFPSSPPTLLVLRCMPKWRTIHASKFSSSRVFGLSSGSSCRLEPMLCQMHGYRN